MRLNKFKSLKSKEDKYLLAKDLYYNGNPNMTDSEFDSLEEELVRLGSKVVEKVGAPVPQVKGIRNKHPHITPMLSLSKFNFVHLDDDEFISFSNHFKNFLKILPNSNNIFLEFSTKFDGNGINIIYKNGELYKILTRGDGIEGNDISTKLWDLCPQKIPYDYEYVEIRAEVVIKLSIFSEKYAETSKNARNFVSGMLNSLSDKNNINISDLSIQMIEMRYLDNENNLNWIQDECILTKSILKIESVDFVKLQQTNYLREIYNNFFVPARLNNEFMVDGIVCKVVDRLDEKYRLQIGETPHHPKWAFAIKFPAVKTPTTIESFEWTMSKTGEIIPIINIKPIDIDGSVVSKCSGHNWGFIANNKKWGGKTLGIGSEVVVEKAGDIIPTIVSILNLRGETPDLKNCPFCNSELRVIENLHLMCENPECDEKLFQHFSRCVDVLEIPFLGDSTKRKFFDSGIKTPFDLILCDNILDIGIKESANLKKINDFLLKRKEIELYKIILAMGIKDCGSTIAKELANKFSGMDFSTKGLQKNVFDDFENNYKIRLSKYILKLHDKGIDVISPFIEDEKHRIDFQFEMTGSPMPYYKNKAEVSEFMKQFNGQQCGRFDKDVKYLFTDDLDSETSKMKKAKKLNIEIVSYEKLNEKFKKLI